MEGEKDIDKDEDFEKVKYMFFFFFSSQVELKEMSFQLLIKYMFLTWLLHVISFKITI